MSTPEGLTVRRSDREGPRPAVIVLPGGGYEEHGEASAEPMADWFASLGLHAMVFRYPLRAPDRRGPLHPEPIDATRRVFAWLRSGQAATDTGLAIDRDRVGVCGSSAGGHLAASLANGIDDPALDRPAFCVLSHPVVTMEAPTRPRPVVGLLGDAPSWRARRQLSMETRVDERTPPTFVWATATDRITRATNALAYADALVRMQVPVEAHVFPRGRHGAGVDVDDPHTAQWVRLCENWLRYQRILTD